MQIRLGVISQYWKNESLDGTIIISYFGGSNNIFVNCTLGLFKIIWFSTKFTTDIKFSKMAFLIKIKYPRAKTFVKSFLSFSLRNL